MNRAKRSNRSNSQLSEGDWQQFVDRHGAAVWGVIDQAGLPFEAALEVNRLTWMRLADHIDELQPERVDLWLRQTAMRESARSSRLVEMTTTFDQIAD